MTEPPVDPDLLNGWKEIASWSGKSVRSVQRWERDLGLPVHRIKTPDGQSVYARRSELDAWRASLDVHRTNALDQEHGPDGVPGPEETGGDVEPAPRVLRGRAVLAGAAFLLLAVVVWVVVPGDAGGRSVVSDYQYVDSRLLAVDASGRTVWEHDFGYPVTSAGFSDPGVVPLVVDMDGDGSNELLIGVKHRDAFGTTRVADALYCFNDAGEPCWVVQPDLGLACGRETYGAPWQLSAVAVVNRDGGKRVWAAFNHHTWWPGVVLEIRPDGQSAIVYVQSGWIMSLAEWQAGGVTYLVAGGVFNESERASISFVPVSRLPAMSPYEDDRFACGAEPTGRPDRVFGLPTFDMHTVSAPYPFVFFFFPMNGALKASYGDGNSPVVVEINENLELVTLAPADGYWVRHRQASNEGQVDHDVDECPEHDAIKVVHEWSDRTGWTSTDWPMRR